MTKDQDLKFTIIAIGGCMCAGKSYVLSEFKDNPKIASWDITEWYKKNGVIVDGDFDWNIWREKGQDAWPAFMSDVAKAITSGKKAMLLETSGTNKQFNDNLKIFNHRVINIYLKIPTEEHMIKNIEARQDVSKDKVLSFRYKYNQNTPALYEEELTVEEAGLYIKSYLETL